MEGVIFIVTWVSGPTACMKCVALNGKEWIVDNIEAIPLIYMTLSHPHCKCEVDIQIDVDTEMLQVG